MTIVKTRIHVGPDGTLTGKARGLPVGDHEAEITLVDTSAAVQRSDAAQLLARVRAIQAEVAQLPYWTAAAPTTYSVTTNMAIFADGH